MKKGIVLPFLLLLATVALIIGAFFLLNNKQKITGQKPTQIASPSPANETTNWKTYISEDKSFNFRYPNEWIYDKQEAQNFLFKKNYKSEIIFVGNPLTENHYGEKVPPYPGPDFRLTITSSEDFQNRSLEDFAKQYIYVQEIKDTAVNNVLAKSIFHGGSLSGRTFAVVLKNENTLYELSIPENASPQGGRIFNQILSTFKFTDQSLNTTNWKTYINAAYGYQIQYPPNVPINEDKYGVWLDKQIWIHVSLAPESPCRGDCPVDESTEDIKIGELNAKKILGYVGSMDGIPQRYQRIEILHKGYLYEIWLYALKFDNDLPFDDSEIKEIPKEEIDLFNQILSTFQFIN